MRCVHSNCPSDMVSGDLKVTVCIVIEGCSSGRGLDCRQAASSLTPDSSPPAMTGHLVSGGAPVGGRAWRRVVRVGSWSGGQYCTLYF